MKIKMITKLLIVLLTMGMLLSSCGKKKDIDDSSTETGTIEEEQKIDENLLEEVEDEVEEEADELNDNASMEKYEAFLNGQEKVGISKVDLNSYMYEGMELTIDHSKSYTMEELLESFFKDRLYCNDNCYSVDSLEYAYVDMGKDGTMELVLHFMSHILNDEYSNIMIIKNIDDKLEMCYFTEDGYRAYNYVNQDGVVAVGGSGGASVWYDCYRTLDSDGNVIYLYDSQSMGAYNVYVDGEDYSDIAEKLGVAEDISIIRYSFEEYISDDYDEKSYDEYLDKSYYTYEKYANDGNLARPSEIYESTSKYAKFMNLISDNVHPYDEMQSIIDKHLKEYGLSRDMLEDNEPDWIKWEGHEELFASTIIPAEVVIVENPSWEYYSTDYPYEVGVDDFVTLSEISHEANDITDDIRWFNEIGIAMPEAGVIHDPSFMYTYKLTSQYGQYYHQYDTVTIHNNYTDRDETVLDFSNYIIPDQMTVGDADYVRECVNYIQIVDSVAYVIISHRTYAESAPHNAYIVALDIENDFKVIWKSEPLTCNSDNFAIVDGSIICGYGFTAEPDYIYELNRYTGERMETIKVKTGPDYFYAIDGKLYVRTYDTNYVYQISWG